jgi:hypothetical protein
LFFLSHKAGRVVVPFCLIGLVITNLLLIGTRMYALFGVLQASFYLLALAGAFWRLHPKILGLPFYFTMVNAAALVGIVFATTGRRIEWKRRTDVAVHSRRGAEQT